MAGHLRRIASIAVISLLLLGGFLAAGTARTTVAKAPAPSRAWVPKSTDWPTFHNGYDRAGLTDSTATMKLAYYKWAVKTGGMVDSSPAVATVNVNYSGYMFSGPKIFVGSQDGRLYCIDGSGSLTLWRYQATSAITSSPSVGDLSVDGSPEVVFGSVDGRIFCVNCFNGTLAWRYTTRGTVHGSPALLDLNGDGKLEVAVGSQDGRFYVLNADGTALWTATMVQDGSGILAAPAVGDVNADGKPELVVETEESDITCFAGADGKVLWSYSGLAIFPFGIRTPVIADIEGDGRMEVLALGNTSHACCLNGNNGTVKWYRSFSGTFMSSPAVADAEGDGILDIFIADYNGMLCVNGSDGTVKWTRRFADSKYSYGGMMDSSPALADIDGDGRLEVMFGSSDRMMHSVNAEDGSPRWAWPCPMLVRSSPALADIDTDGKAEVVFGCNDQKVYALDYNF